MYDPGCPGVSAIRHFQTRPLWCFRLVAAVARNEQDREDILREATALVERVEFMLNAYPEPVVIGFRRDGSASIFIGADPVFQFNSKHQLRRAFVAGKLIKAERGRLVSLDRHRTADQVQLVRSELDDAATQRLLEDLTSHLQVLGGALRQDSFVIRGQVPESVDVMGRVRDWLTRLPTPLAVAARPHAG